MFSIRLNSVVRLAFAATLASAPTILPAQFWRASSGGCNCGGPAPMAQMSAPVSMAAASFDATPGCQCYTPAPAPVTTAVVQACPQYMQPIHQTMYRDVPVTQYRPVKKMATRQVMKTKMVDKPVTTYKQVVETKMQEVPTTTYQTITEMKQVVNNRSHWQTTMQPVPKMSACQYDPRQGMLGSMNRSAYNFRQAFTPDNIPRKEFVPQVCVCNVPTQRTVAVPTTRQVAYQTTRLEPVTVMQQVATYVPETVEEEVTVMEPYTVTKTMAVGHSTTCRSRFYRANGSPWSARTGRARRLCSCGCAVCYRANWVKWWCRDWTRRMPRCAGNSPKSSASCSRIQTISFSVRPCSKMWRLAR